MFAGGWEVFAGGWVLDWLFEGGWVLDWLFAGGWVLDWLFAGGWFLFDGEGLGGGWLFEGWLLDEGFAGIFGLKVFKYSLIDVCYMDSYISYKS